MTLRPQLWMTLCQLLILTLSPSLICGRQGNGPDYQDLVERLKKGDLSVDFAALRQAYADSSSNEGEDPEDRRAMFSAIRNNDYDTALERAQKILKSRYVDIDAHLVAAAAYKQKNDLEKAKLHHAVAQGLIKSILNSGNGKSPETAFNVIETSEEYSVLRAFGLMPGSQSLIGAGGHHYDKLEAVDPKTKKNVVLYFNIDREFAALEKSLKGR